MTIRPAAVAGLFYPDDPGELASSIDALLEDAGAPSRACPKALIAPHAGLPYSGPIAARAYALLRRDAARIRRVVLVGPSHRVPVRGLALPGADALRTPLGDVEATPDAALADLPQVVTSALAHAREHSLEVHLPFLQRLLPSFSIVALVVGRASPAEVADVLERLWGGDETRIVISSDLSHFLPYEDAQRADAETVARVLAREPVRPDDACGAYALNGLAELARRRDLRGELLDLRSSGDTAGDRHRVVGYASLAFAAGAPS